MKLSAPGGFPAVSRRFPAVVGITFDSSTPRGAATAVRGWKPVQVTPDIPEGSTAQVRFAGTWYEARVISWCLEDESWWARVRWVPPSGKGLLGSFPEWDVRRLEEHSGAGPGAMRTRA